MRPASWSSILFIVNYSSTRVLLYAKMLKETENEETRFFCQTFVIGDISIEGTRVPWATSLATPMIWSRVATETANSNSRTFLGHFPGLFKVFYKI